MDKGRYIERRVYGQDAPLTGPLRSYDSVGVVWHMGGGDIKCK